MVCYALCAIAESQVRANETERATQTLKSVRGIITEIATILGKPNAATVHDVTDLLSELEGKVQSIEGTMQSKTDSQ